MGGEQEASPAHERSVTHNENDRFGGDDGEDTYDASLGSRHEAIVDKGILALHAAGDRMSPVVDGLGEFSWHFLGNILRSVLHDCLWLLILHLDFHDEQVDGARLCG